MEMYTLADLVMAAGLAAFFAAGWHDLKKRIARRRAGIQRESQW